MCTQCIYVSAWEHTHLCTSVSLAQTLGLVVCVAVFLLCGCWSRAGHAYPHTCVLGTGRVRGCQAGSLGGEQCGTHTPRGRPPRPSRRGYSKDFLTYPQKLLPAELDRRPDAPGASPTQLLLLPPPGRSLKPSWPSSAAICTCLTHGQAEAVPDLGAENPKDQLRIAPGPCTKPMGIQVLVKGLMGL